MSTPKGTRCRKIALATDGCIHVYSKGDQIVLQLRRSVPTQDDLLATSFKVGVPLRASEALELACELLAVTSTHIERFRAEAAQ